MPEQQKIHMSFRALFIFIVLYFLGSKHLCLLCYPLIQRSPAGQIYSPAGRRGGVYPPATSVMAITIVWMAVMRLPALVKGDSGVSNVL